MKVFKLIIVFILLSSLTFAQLNDSSFFPISVWLQSTNNAKAYKKAGINMYVGLWNEPNQKQLDELNSAGMYVICKQNDFGLAHLDDPIITGWIQQDEPDNAQWNDSTKSYDPCVAPSKIISLYNKYKTNDSSRPVFLGLGRGVSDINWKGRGKCTGNYKLYPDYLNGYIAGCNIIKSNLIEILF